MTLAQYMRQAELAREQMNQLTAQIIDRAAAEGNSVTVVGDEIVITKPPGEGEK